MFVVFTRVGRLGAFLADDAELLGREDGLPFVVGFLKWVVRHVVAVGAGGCGEEGADEG